LDAAKQLFSSRGALTRTDEIEDAHSLTEGHAFWLDLLAIQISKRAPRITLTSLVDEIRSGGGPLPAATLNSIWSTLHGREQTVLRAMAETVKPEDEGQIAEYLRYTLNYQRTMKAIRALRSANLIVVKRRGGGKDLLELHPLVRQFIRQNFSPPERLGFIDAILTVYRRFIVIHKPNLGGNPSFTILQFWTQNAELYRPD